MKLHVYASFLSLCAALSASAKFPMANLRDDDCAAFQQYLQLRVELEQAPEDQKRDFSTQWLPRLIDVSRSAGCGTGVASPRWHAMTLANYLENWDIAANLAEEGRRGATGSAERAMWSMNSASATFNLRTPSDRASVLAALRALDTFIAEAPGMSAASVAPGGPPAWLIPSLSSFCRKATCQRDLQDYLGAAFTEQRGVTAFLAANAEVGPSYGGFLPEEALFRASVDYIRAGRLTEAAGSLAAIRALPHRMRDAGLHGYNAVIEAALVDGTGLKSLELMEELLRQQSVDHWTVLQVGVAANLIRDDNGPHASRAINCINLVLAEGDGLALQADQALRAYREAGGQPAGADEAAGQYSNLLQSRCKLELASGDFDGAQRSVASLVARNAFTSEWRTQMTLEIESRRAARGR